MSDKFFRLTIGQRSIVLTTDELRRVRTLCDTQLDHLGVGREPTVVLSCLIDPTTDPGAIEAMERALGEAATP